MCPSNVLVEVSEEKWIETKLSQQYVDWQLILLTGKIKIGEIIKR